MPQDQHITPDSGLPEHGQEMPSGPTTANDTSMSGTLVMAAAIAAPVLLASCGGGGGGGDTSDTSPTLTFTSIDIRVVSDTPTAAVAVNGRTQAGDPSTAPLNFPLNGAPLASDPGKKAAAKSYDLVAHVADGDTDQKYTITVNPSASTIFAAIGASRVAESKHLAARTGFGASLDDLLVLAGMTYDEAVDFIVDHLLTTATQSPLPWYQSDINDNEWEYRRMLKEWWLREIVRTPSPFTERLVAFWGNHFVVNIDDIEEPSVGWAWQDFLRKNVGGNLRTFIHDMCLHPAMMIYLDNRSNKKVAPPGSPTGTAKTLPSNENFGRELLELFLIGEGKGYVEADVIAVARAFTGHNLTSTLQYEFYLDRHDTADLVILGSTPGPFGGTKGDVYDVVDRIITTGQSNGSPRTAKLIVEKLWAEFIGTDPAANTAAVEQLAATLYGPDDAHRWELKPLYKALLRRNEFKAGITDMSQKLLKTPLELICGFYRSLGLTPKDGHWDWKVYDSGGEDQDPLAPPNVKGWLGGITWINAKTLLERFGHMTNYGWELSDSLLPLSVKDGYTDVLLNIPRVLTPEPVPSWETTNPFSWMLRDLVKDPAYNIK
jgi:uncharacterized protein (DUF1800 family)